ncbi:acyl-CoA dehydrogenase family protein [Sporichthya brevicatena]|uniref:Acyl-CoA dehydrogenase family protein n=1 Tax=Sporichthya brevicatena TaxID=171442 RepID=A0ABN1GYK4_9ACTN
MRLAFTPEQSDLRAAVRELCRDHAADTDLRRVADLPGGFDPKVYDQVAGMGLLGLAVPEFFGGAGCGWVEVGVVLEEFGRALLPVPYFSSAVLAVAALLACDDPGAHADYLPRIVDGSLLATVGLTGTTATWEGAGVTVTARPGDRDWILHGEMSYVCDGAGADLLLVFARSPEGGGLFAVDAPASGIRREALQVVDLTRPQAHIVLDDVPARLIGQISPSWRPFARVLDIAATALAAESLGGAQRTLEMAVDHAKIRKQFGRPIGSFQAIKHLCADVLVRVESARSAAYYALHATGVGGEVGATAASLAKAHCGDAFLYAAEQNVLVHGAIGLSWEHSAQLYLKRAKTTAVMFGDATHHREQLAQRIGL